MQNMNRFPQNHMYSVRPVAYYDYGFMFGGNKLALYHSKILLQE